jgi:DNA repair photolyase
MGGRGRRDSRAGHVGCSANCEGCYAESTTAGENRDVRSSNKIVEIDTIADPDRVATLAAPVLADPQPEPRVISQTVQAAID